MGKIIIEDKAYTVSDSGTLEEICKQLNEQAGWEKFFVTDKRKIGWHMDPEPEIRIMFGMTK